MPHYWEVDPDTKDYSLSGGKPVPTDSLTVPAFYRWKIKRGKWLYAPNAEYGSQFDTVKKNLSSSNDQSLLENFGADALKPLLDDGRATEITVAVTEQVRHGIRLGAQITTAAGEVEQFTLSPIGVR